MVWPGFVVNSGPVSGQGRASVRWPSQGLDSAVCQAKESAMGQAKTSSVFFVHGRILEPNAEIHDQGHLDINTAVFATSDAPQKRKISWIVL